MTTSHVPLAVLTGWTATGKTTAATALAEATDLRRFAVSDRLVTALGHQDKAARLRSWLTQDADSCRISGPEIDRAIDLRVLDDLDSATEPLVVEAIALPWLLPPVNNTALVIRVEASLAVRVDRLRGLLPDLTDTEAETILTRKDAATRVALRAAWGIDPAAAEAANWRADLVLGCPERDGCPDGQACADATAQVITAAYQVYRHRLATTDATAAEGWLRRAIDADPLRVLRCSPLLLGAAGHHQSWRQRQLTELAYLTKETTS